MCYGFVLVMYINISFVEFVLVFEISRQVKVIFSLLVVDILKIVYIDCLYRL